VHIRWETLTTSREFGCTVEPGPSEVWADQTPPLRYRLVAPRLEPYPATGGRDLACAVGTPTEVGGTLKPRQTLRFLPPDTLMEDASAFASWDVAASLREALRSGTAVAEGKVTLDGRVVERFRMNPRCPAEPCPAEPRDSEPGYAYVDPETFYPVRLDLPGTYGSPDGHDLHVVDSYRILTYEYLPRTTANIALTDIRAQHPDATVAGR
jgi:hypothetical protein